MFFILSRAWEKQNRTKKAKERKKTLDSYQLTKPIVLTYETVKMLLPSDKVTNDFDWMRTEVGNLSDKLNTLMARQHEAQDQGEFLIPFITSLLQLKLTF